MKLAPCPARSVAAATFAFYLADPISSIHEFALIEASRMKIREIRVYLSETLASAGNFDLTVW